MTPEQKMLKHLEALTDIQNYIDSKLLVLAGTIKKAKGFFSNKEFEFSDEILHEYLRACSALLALTDLKLYILETQNELLKL